MLGVISQRASVSTITRTLRVLEETLGKHEDDVALLEAIVICLTRMVPLLDEVCVCVSVWVCVWRGHGCDRDLLSVVKPKWSFHLSLLLIFSPQQSTKITQHLFWVAVGILQVHTNPISGPLFLPHVCHEYS